MQPVGQPDRVVREAVHLVELESTGPGDAHHHPTGGGTQVDRDDGPAGHRRKAAATPESTGTWTPVETERSPPTSAKTASATCSGRTSRLSSVRLA